MFARLMTFASLLIATNVWAYSSLECVSNGNVTYTSHSKVGGVRPFPGMIINVEEIIKNDEVLYRKVRREECDAESFCRLQNPELVDIISPEFSFHFIEASKTILSSEGRGHGAEKKETYAVKFVLDQEMWMLCHSLQAFYP